MTFSSPTSRAALICYETSKNARIFHSCHYSARQHYAGKSTNTICLPYSLFSYNNPWLILFETAIAAVGNKRQAGVKLPAYKYHLYQLFCNACWFDCCDDVWLEAPADNTDICTIISGLLNIANFNV
jgi:hypothetical protein